MGRDRFDYIDAARKVAKDEIRRELSRQSLAVGTIRGLTLSGASVQLAESGRYLRNVHALKGVDLLIGAEVFVARVGHQDWTIIGAVEQKGASTATTRNTTTVAGIQNLSMDEHEGYMVIEWDGSYFPIECYEVQVNTVASETGATVYVTDNTQLLYHDVEGSYYVRARAVGPSWRKGSWSAWTVGSVEAVSADADAIHDNVASEFYGVTAKGTPHNDDIVLIEDSEASWVKKKVTVSNLGGGGGGGEDADAIHDNVASEIYAVGAKASPTTTDLVLIEDSAAGWAKKRVELTKIAGGTMTHELWANDGSPQALDVDANGEVTVLQDVTFDDGSGASPALSFVNENDHEISFSNVNDADGAILKFEFPDPDGDSAIVFHASYGEAFLFRSDGTHGGYTIKQNIPLSDAWGSCNAEVYKGSPTLNFDANGETFYAEVPISYRWNATSDISIHILACSEGNEDSGDDFIFTCQVRSYKWDWASPQSVSDAGQSVTVGREGGQFNADEVHDCYGYVDYDHATYPIYREGHLVIEGTVTLGTGGAVDGPVHILSMWLQLTVNRLGDYTWTGA